MSSAKMKQVFLEQPERNEINYKGTIKIRADKGSQKTKTLLFHCEKNYR